MASDPILDLDETADRLNVSRRTVERRIADGSLRAVHPSPRRVGVEESEILRYLREHRDGEGP